MSVTEHSDAVRQEWLNRSREVNVLFRASLRPPLALCLVGWFVILSSTYPSRPALVSTQPFYNGYGCTFLGVKRLDLDVHLLSSCSAEFNIA